ncbi:MAG: ATP-grasp domain-containing protein [Thermoplasmatota archaeon]
MPLEVDDRMRLYEHEGKKIFSDFGIKVPKGLVVDNIDELKQDVNKIGLPCVLKAQVLTGGRGKAGGVKVVESVHEAEIFAEELLSKEIRGYVVNKILIEERIEVDKEIFFSIIGDDEKNKYRIMVSMEGGVDIEELAEESPEKIITFYKSPLKDLEDYESREMLRKVGFRGKTLVETRRVLSKLFKIFTTLDAKVVEINPLVLSKDKEVIALDSKIEIDDNSLDRHPELKKIKDEHLVNELEKEAKEKGINFVDSKGDIAVMANGAGLAMALMDSLNDLGGHPAAFLDTGGGLSERRMKDAMTILFKKAKKDKDVKAILFVFRMMISPPDAMAKGIRHALDEFKDIDIPIIGILRGRDQYVEEGKKLLKDTPLELYPTVKEGTLEALKNARGDQR